MNTTITSYSKSGAAEYEDPMNKNFLYGDVTVQFIKQINISFDEGTILDIGCGTGFIFDELRGNLDKKKIKGIGIEPAEGMLDLARGKYISDPQYAFETGSFESIPLKEKSVNKIVSTLALHWVDSIEIACREMRRVLRDDGSLDILMIAKDDGARFKRAIVAALKKHLNFAQIMRTAVLVQRQEAKDILNTFSPIFDGFELDVTEHRQIVYGSFDEHMKWWKARSTPVIAEVEDKEAFMNDLRVELEKMTTPDGIPFDTAYLYITAKAR